MYKTFYNKFSGLTNRAWLLLVLVALGGGLGLLAFYRQQGPRVKELTGVIEARHHAGAMAFSPDGKTLALPNWAHGRLELWRLNAKDIQVLVSSFNKDGSPATRVAFSKDGSLLAVAYRYKGVSLWDLSTRKEQAHIAIALPSELRDMTFVENSHALITIMSRITEQDRAADQQNCSAVFWEGLTGKMKNSVVFDPRLLFRALSPDGRYAILENQGVPTVFDLATGEKAFDIAINGGFRFSADGSAVVTYTGDQVSLWDVSSQKESRRFVFKPGYNPRSYDCTDHLAISPDKSILAIGGFKDTQVVGLISLVSGRVLDAFECCPSSMFCDVLCFSPDGRILATNTESSDMLDRSVRPLLRFWKIPESW